MLDLGKKLRDLAHTDDSEDLFSTAGKSAVPETDPAEEPAAVFERFKAADVQDESEADNSFDKRQMRRKDNAVADKMESARLLEEARCRMGISHAEVEEITKIRALYIAALEHGDFDELPQPVYTLAYLRRLCELYGLSKDEEERIIAPWSELQFEFPDNYSTTVYSDESGDNRKVIRKLEIAIFSVIVLAIAGLLVFGVILLIPLLRGNSGKNSVPFDENGIVKVQPAPRLEVNESLPGSRR